MISGKFLTRPKTRKFQFKPFIPKSFHINLPPHGERTEIPVIWFFRGSSPCFRLWGVLLFASSMNLNSSVIVASSFPADTSDGPV